MRESRFGEFASEQLRLRSGFVDGTEWGKVGIGLKLRKRILHKTRNRLFVARFKIRDGTQVVFHATPDAAMETHQETNHHSSGDDDASAQEDDPVLERFGAGGAQVDDLQQAEIYFPLLGRVFGGSDACGKTVAGIDRLFSRRVNRIDQRGGIEHPQGGENDAPPDEVGRAAGFIGGFHGAVWPRRWGCGLKSWTTLFRRPLVHPADLGFAGFVEARCSGSPRGSRGLVRGGRNGG